MTLLKSCVKITYVKQNKQKIKVVFKMMDKNELMEKMDEMVEILGVEYVLEELARAMSSDELQANLKFIDRMNETNLFD